MSICMMTASGHRHFLGISALLQCNPKCVKRFSVRYATKQLMDTRDARDDSYTEGNEAVVTCI